MALGASDRCASAVVVVAAAVIIVAAAVVVVGTAAAVLSAVAASFLASLHGSLEELAGVASCRRIVAGGVDLLGGVGSLPGEAVIFTALQFFLE